MQRFRGILGRLAPLARIYVAGISYDPFVSRRLSMLYHVREHREGVALEDDVKATRPVTTSALLGTWLDSHREPFTAREATEGVRAGLAALPAHAFVDPELARDPDAMTLRAVQELVRSRALVDGGGSFALQGPVQNAQFPRTDDMIAYQARFHAETLEGLRATAVSSA
jgi:hypothetical protein